jgi:hypothetical protein
MMNFKVTNRAFSYRHADIWFFLLLGSYLVLGTNLYEVVVTGSHVLSKGDQIWWYGAFHYFVTNLSLGIFPTWNPFNHGGEPFYFLISMYRFADPLILFPVLANKITSIDLLHIYNIYYLTKHLIFLAGVYLLVRNFLSALAPRLLFITLIFGGLHHEVFFDSMLYIDSVLWLPWGAYFTIRAASRTSLASLYLASSFFGLQIGAATYHGIPTALLLLTFSIGFLLTSFSRVQGFIPTYRYHIFASAGLFGFLCIPLLVLYFDQDWILGVTRVHGFRDQLINGLENPANSLEYRDLVLHPTHGGVHIQDPVQYLFGQTFFYRRQEILVLLVHGLVFCRFPHRRLLILCFSVLLLLGMSVQTPFYEWVLQFLPFLTTIRHATVFGAANFILVTVFIAFSLRAICEGPRNQIKPFLDLLAAGFISAGIYSLAGDGPSIRLLSDWGFECCVGNQGWSSLVYWVPAWMLVSISRSCPNLAQKQSNGSKPQSNHKKESSGCLSFFPKFSNILGLTIIAVMILQPSLTSLSRFDRDGFYSVVPREQIMALSEDTYSENFASKPYSWPARRQLCQPRTGWILYSELITGTATALDNFIEPSSEKTDEEAARFLSHCTNAVFGNRVIYWPTLYTDVYLLGETSILPLKDLAGVDRPTTRFYPDEQIIFLPRSESIDLFSIYYDNYAEYVTKYQDLWKAFNNRGDTATPIGVWGRQHWRTYGKEEARQLSDLTLPENQTYLTDLYLFLSPDPGNNHNKSDHSKVIENAFGTNIAYSEWVTRLPATLFHSFSVKLEELLNVGKYDDALFQVLRFGFSPNRLTVRTAYLDTHRDRPRLVVLSELLRRKVAEAEAPPMSDLITSSNVNSVTLGLKSKTNGYVLLADTYDPRWTTLVDGAPHPILIANISQKAVRVLEEARIVVFSYGHLGYKYASLLAIFAPLFFMLLAIGRRLRIHL